MLRPRNILFPVDFSKANEAIIDHVVGLACTFDAKIWLLSVVASLAEYHGLSEAYFGPFSDKALIKFEAERKALICDHFRRLGIMQKEHFGSVETEICVKSGGVAESIVESAHEMDMPLVMMPTRATGPGRRFLIGSVTAKVLHDASCPVWTSPHPLELEPFRRYRHIALATDYREFPTELLIQAAEIAEFFQARLSVFSALPACA